MSELDLHQRAFKRAVIEGDRETAEEARRFILREYKRQGLDYGTALRLVSNLNDKVIEARDTGIVGNLVKGMGAGAVGLGESAALGIAALQEEEAELESREKIKDFFGGLRPEGGNPDALSYKLGSGLGSIAALAPAALLAKPLGVGAAIATAGSVSMAAGAGEASERAREESATEEERNTASLLGTLVGVSEVLPLGRMFKAFEIKGLNKLISKADPEEISGIVSRLKNAGKTGTVEGLQEFGAAVAQNAIERGYNPEQLLVDYQTAEEGGIGAAAGAIIQGIIDTVAPGSKRSGSTTNDTGTGSDVVPTEPTEPTEPTTDIVDPEVARVADELAGDEPQQETTEQELNDIVEELATQGTVQEEDLDVPAVLRRTQEEQRSEELQDEILDAETTPERKIRPRRKDLRPVPEGEGTAYSRQNDITDEEAQEMFGARAPKTRAPIPEGEGTAFSRQYGVSDAEATKALGAEERLQGQERLRERQSQNVQDALGRMDAQQVPQPERTDSPEIEALFARRQQAIDAKQDAQVEAINQQILEAKQQAVVEPEPVEQGTPGVRKVNRQRTVRKELKRGQEQRQKHKDRQADARKRMQEIIAARKAKNEQPVVEPEQPRSPEEVGQTPIAQAVQSGLKQQQQQQQEQTTQPEKTDIKWTSDKLDAPGMTANQYDYQRKPDYFRKEKDIESEIVEMSPDQYIDEAAKILNTSREQIEKTRTDLDYLEKAVADGQEIGVPYLDYKKGGQEGLHRAILAKRMGAKSIPVQVIKSAKGENKTAPASKPKTQKQATTKSKTTAKPKSQAAKKAEVKKPVAKKPTPPPAKKEEKVEQDERRAKRNVTTKRTGKKNQQVKPEKTDQKVSDAVRNINKSEDAALSKYLNAAQGDTDVLVDSIAFDIVAKEPERQPRRGDPSLRDEGKRLYDEDGNEQKNTIDKRLAGTGETAAKKALAAMKKGDLAPLAERVEARMKDPDIVKRAELNRKNAGKTSDTLVSEIRNTQDAIRATASRLDQAEAKADTLRGVEYRDFYNLEVRPLENELKALRKRLAQQKKEIKNMPVDAILESAEPVSFGVRSSLVRGNLKEALTRLRESVTDPRLRRLLGKMIENVGDTKVMVMRNLTSPDGTDAAGYFSPRLNTVYIDSVDGMNAHTVIHEVLHAMTSATLAKKNNETTKKMQKIFDEVKDKLGTAYGAKNLDEFVAEAFSNPDFQRHLATLRTDGSPVPVWKRFINTVMNMVRKLFNLETKFPDSAMSELDNLIMSVIHPAPATRPAGELLMESTPDYVETRLGEQARRLEADAVSRQDWKKRLVSLYNTVTNPLRLGLNKILQMQGLADLAEHYGMGDIGHRMLKVFNTQRGRQKEMDERVKRAIKPISKKYNNLSEQQRGYVNNLIYDYHYGATISQVDVEKPETAYTDPFQKEAHKYLKNIWNKMDKNAKDVYRETRAVYKKQRSELESVLRQRIDDTVSQAPQAEKAGLKKRLIEELIEGTRLEVYFPLAREGDHVVAYAAKDQDGEYKEVVRQFESESQAKAYAEAAEADADVDEGSVRVYQRSNQDLSVNQVPPTSFMYDIIKKLEEENVPRNAIDNVIDIYLSTLPEASMAKAYIRRQNVPGYIKDLNYALNKKAYQTGQQLVRLQSVREVGVLKQELKQTYENLATQGKKTAVQKGIFDELNARADFVLNGAKNKSAENVIKNLNQGAFVFTIGFNTASAIVNLSQVPMVVFPMLGGQYGFDAARKAIFTATGIVTRSRNASRADSKGGKALEKMSIANGIDNYFDIKTEEVVEDGKVVSRFKATLRKDLDLSPEEIKLLKPLETIVARADEQGQLTNSFLKEALGLEEGSKQTDAKGFSGLIGKFTGLSAGMFSQAERFSRQVTLLAAYDLEYNKLYSEYKKQHGDIKAKGMARREAADKAIEMTQRYNGGSFLETASGLSQQGLGRLALMYKNYGIQMYTMMFQTARQATKELFKGNPGQQKAAMKQLVGLYGSALFFSGVYGMPLYGAVAAVYDALAEDDEDDFDTVVQSYMSQGMFRGGVNALLEMAGADVDAGIRMRMTDLILQENRFNPNPSPEETIGGLVGGVALSVGKRIYRGANDMAEGDYQRGFEQLLPASFSNILKPFRYVEEGGIRTRRYDLIHGDLSSGEIAAQVVGFAPEQYLRQQERNRRIKNIDEAISSKATSLTKKYYVAMRMGDYKTVRETYKEIIAFNRRNPQFALTPERIQNSIKGHLRTTENMYNGVSISKRMREYLQLQNKDVLDSIMFPNR